MMTRAPTGGHLAPRQIDGRASAKPRAPATDAPSTPAGCRPGRVIHARYRNARDLPITTRRPLVMLTITIIFALLVALWGRFGNVRAG